MAIAVTVPDFAKKWEFTN